MDGIEFKLSQPLDCCASNTIIAVSKYTQQEIGSLTFRFHKHYIYIANFGIYDEKNRNKGIGRAMIKNIKNRFPNQNLCLCCEHKNKAALHLYETEGFKIDKEHLLWYDMIYNANG